MSSLKSMLISLGVALVIVSGGTAIADTTNDVVTPIIIAREAEAVGRAVRVMKKRPMPNMVLHAPAPRVVASAPER